MKKILIIEDDMVAQRFISEVLKRKGYSTILAGEANDGIEKAIEFLPDLILCDIMLPKVTGYKVLETIHQNDKLRNIPFIFITALEGRDNMRKGMNLGADDYIEKPIKMDELVTAVETRINRFDIIKSSTNIDSSNTMDMNDKIFFDFDENIHSVQVAEILMISSDKGNTLIYTAKDKVFKISKDLSVWESVLPQKYFIKPNPETIININYIISINLIEEDVYHITMANEVTGLVSSPAFAEEIKKYLLN